MNKLNVAVRLDQEGRLELFYYDKNLVTGAVWLESFCQHEGHNEATVEYVRKKTKPCKDKAKAEAFVHAWCNITGNKDVVIVSRLNKSK